MTRIVVAMSLIALVFACAHQDPAKSLLKTPASALTTDGRTSPPENRESHDSTFYIGYVDYFPETKEFYTNLYYRKGHEYPDEELLESKLDSVIVLEDDWGRERLPMEEAKKLLVLSGLDTLFIYNRRNELVCNASLTRVEYLWNGMESFFIAVLTPGSKFLQQTGELYGISAPYRSLGVAVVSAEEIEDRDLNRDLMRKMKLSQRLTWNMRHFRTGQRKGIYSVISSYSVESNEGQSYLTSTEGSEVRILNREINNFHFLNILPLPLDVNGKPLLLISAGYPSSDVLWDYLAAFNGESYEAVAYNRIDAEALMTGQYGRVAKRQ
jgi:hypothetical protein